MNRPERVFVLAENCAVIEFHLSRPRRSDVVLDHRLNPLVRVGIPAAIMVSDPAHTRAWEEQR